MANDQKLRERLRPILLADPKIDDRNVEQALDQVVTRYLEGPKSGADTVPEILDRLGVSDSTTSGLTGAVSRFREEDFDEIMTESRQTAATEEKTGKPAGAQAPANPRDALDDSARMEIEAKIRSGEATPDMFPIGSPEREYAESLGEGGLNEDPALVAMQREQQRLATQANELKLFGHEFSDAERDAAVARYNSSPFAAPVDDYTELMERYAADDIRAIDVIADGAAGATKGFTEVTYGWGNSGPKRTFVDNERMTYMSERGMSNWDVAQIIEAEKTFGVELDAGVAIMRLMDVDDEGKATVQLEVERLRRSMDETRKKVDDGVMPPAVGARELARQEERIREIEAKGGMADRRSRREVLTYTGQYARFLEVYDGHHDIALIALKDRNLAAKIWESGTAGMTGDERKSVNQILDDAGIAGPNNGRLQGDQGAGGWLPGMTDAQLNALRTGDVTGATGPTQVTLPDQDSVRETYRNLYRSWFLAEPTEGELSAFVGSINSDTRARAMKATASAQFNPWRELGPSNAGGVIVDEGVDIGASATAGMRANPLYQDLFGKMAPGMNELEYAGQFAGQANTMLGVEGGSATEASRQGMRSGDVNATSRMIMFDKKYRDNSTLMGRMANAANQVARFT